VTPTDALSGGGGGVNFTCGLILANIYKRSKFGACILYRYRVIHVENTMTLKSELGLIKDHKNGII